jgi:Holliday junction resolvase RusA-like endonuclease
MTAFVFNMPLPPPLHALTVNVAKHGRVPSERYKTWTRAATNQVMAQQRPAEPIAVPVLLEIDLQRKDARKADASNRIKAPEDLLVKAGILADDRYVVEVRARWCINITGCRVRLTELHENDDWRAIGLPVPSKVAA